MQIDIVKKSSNFFPSKFTDPLVLSSYPGYIILYSVRQHNHFII